MIPTHALALVATASLLGLGLVVGIVGFAVAKAKDIHQERQEAARTRQKFLDVIELAADWVWETDSDHRLVYLSDRLQEVTGLSPASLLGKRRTELPEIRGVDRAAWDRHMADLEQHRPFRDFRYTFVDADGRQRTFSVSGKPIFDRRGRFQGHRGTGTDLTDAEEARAAAAEIEQRARAVLDGALDAFVSIDEAGRVVDWNRAAETVFGWRRDEALGRRLRELMVPESELEAHEQMLARLRDGRSGILNRRANTRAMRRGGETFPCELTITETRTRGRRYFNAFMRDVTEQRRYEEVLQRAREQAEVANRAKSEFLAAMSHELRTPLNAVIGFADLLMRQPELDPARRGEYLGDIHASGTHLLQLINDILDISKVEAGRMELHEQTIDVARTCEASVRLLSERANEAGVELRLEASEPLPNVVADEKRLKQVLFNLIGNAIKFTDAGGTVSVRPAMAPDGRLQIGVTDTGIGMPADQTATALQPFTQLRGGHARRQDGTGLGLALCAAIAELHGGDLEIESEVDRGTTVALRLPQDRLVPGYRLAASGE